MSSYEFETHEPVDLYVELGKGDIIVTASDTTATTVEVEGREPDGSTSTRTAARSA